MRFRAPPLSAVSPRLVRQLLGRLLLVALAASACTKEAPREPPPPADEPAAHQTPEPAPPPAAEPEAPSEQELRKEESSEPGGFRDKAAPAKPAAPAAAAKKGRARAEAAPPAEPNPSSIDRDDSSAESLRRQLGKAIELSTPDCPSARERKQAICDLAGQLCQLVDRDPDVASVESYCADARQRCSEAQRRTAERCPR